MNITKLLLIKKLRELSVCGDFYTYENNKVDCKVRHHITKYKKDKKYTIAVRVSDADLLSIDEIAAREKRTRSEILRLIIQRGINDGKEKQKVAI